MAGARSEVNVRLHRSRLYSFSFGTCLLASLVLSASCSDELSPRAGPVLFQIGSGLQVEVLPDHIEGEAGNRFLLRVNPVYSGTGVVYIQGHAGGHPVGLLTSPQEQEIGICLERALFVGGEQNLFEFDLSIYSHHSRVGVTVGASFDTLVVDGQQIATTSAEFLQLFGYDTSTTISATTTLSRE